MRRMLVVETAGHGGLLHYAVQLADGLAETVPEVDLLVSRGHEFSSHVGRARQVAVLPMLTPTIRATATGGRRLIRRAGVALRMCRSWARIVLEVRRRRPDAVVMTMDVSHGPAAVALILLTVLPGGPLLVQVCHNATPFNRGSGGLFRLGRRERLLVGIVFRRVDVVLVHGRRTAEEFRTTWGSAPRVAVVPHGDERLLAGEPVVPADEERVLFFGDWRKIKGLPVLMEAFDLVGARRPAARLTIAGSPAPADFDPDLVRRWAADRADRVTVLDDYVPSDEVPELFAAARVVVTPYLVGFQSGVVHLAMTKGLPVVTSDVGDLPGVVEDGVTGRVVPPGDPAALADALVDLLADPELAAAMGKAGLSAVQEHAGWPRIGEEICAILGRHARTSS